uniref:laccase n=1 Tax=Salvia miltiorrhiza TaxID=226208 RepID=A0A4Y5RSM4_SALMI|nr:laccase 24 [Salvia miltiorrhiza]
MKVLEEFVASGGQPRDSDAYTINGQPGELYPCSAPRRFVMKVDPGKTYLLRIVNADMNEILFFGVARHHLTVVGTDGCYTEPLTRGYIAISPGQTMDCLLRSDQPPARYYMAACPYVNGAGISFDNTTATAILRYAGSSRHTPPEFPKLPSPNDTSAALNFTYSIKSLISKLHPIVVPQKINKRITTTVSVNVFPCEACAGPNGTRLAAAMNNISFSAPPVDILEAYYYQIPGIFSKKFPESPPLVFNYTADFIPLELEIPKKGTKVAMLRYNSNIEVVFQGTNQVGGLDHPMHLHGFSFFVVGWGFGNFDPNKDPLSYNLVDPQKRNTVIVPRNGWTAIRFTADNPGVWFLHCHFERHLTWGMETVFIVRSGRGPAARVLPPPPDMPPC